MVFFLLRCFDYWSPPERKEIRKEGTEEGRKASRMIGRKKEGRRERKKEGIFQLRAPRSLAPARTIHFLCFLIVLYTREKWDHKKQKCGVHHCWAGWLQIIFI